MDKPRGWILLHRSIQEHCLWQKKPFDEARAWIDLLLLANHADVKVYKDGQIAEFKRGTVNRSILSLAERWGWERKKVRRFLSVLERDNMVTVNSTTRGTTITLVNYGVYQDMRATEWATDGTTPPPQTKNDKKNEVKKEKRNRGMIPPTLEEVNTYCLERNNGIDAQAFIDFYESKGWMVGKNKMQDWKAAVRTWERKRKQENRGAQGGITDEERRTSEEQREFYRTHNI